MLKLVYFTNDGLKVFTYKAYKFPHICLGQEQILKGNEARCESKKKKKTANELLIRRGNLIHRNKLSSNTFARNPSSYKKLRPLRDVWNEPISQCETKTNYKTSS